MVGPFTLPRRHCPISGLRPTLVEQRASASRARGLQRKPRVDALDVEPVMTLGQHPDLLPIAELSETYRALRRRDAGPRPVHLRRDLAECLLLESGSRRRLGDLESKTGAGAPDRAPQDGTQPQRTYQSTKQCC